MELLGSKAAQNSNRELKEEDKYGTYLSWDRSNALLKKSDRRGEQKLLLTIKERSNIIKNKMVSGKVYLTSDNLEVLEKKYKHIYERHLFYFTQSFYLNFTTLILTKAFFWC